MFVSRAELASRQRRDQLKSAGQSVREDYRVAALDTLLADSNAVSNNSKDPAPDTLFADSNVSTLESLFADSNAPVLEALFADAFAPTLELPRIETSAPNSENNQLLATLFSGSECRIMAPTVFSGNQMNMPVVQSALRALTAFILLAAAFAPAFAQEVSPASAFPSSVQQKPESQALKDIAASDLKLTVDPQDLVIRGKHGLKIKVSNNSDRAVIFSGELATATQKGKKLKCMDIDEFDYLVLSRPTFINTIGHNTREVVSAALTVGALQTANDVLKNRSVLKSYGKDEERRQDEEERFGQRILWPGDSSTGIILFSDAKESLAGAQIKLPVSSFFDIKDQAFISNSK